MNNRFLNNLYPTFAYILKIHLLGLFLLSFIRLILLYTNLQNVDGVDSSYVLMAFRLGFFMDNITVSFVSLLPLAVSIVLSCWSTDKVLVRYIYNIYYIVSYIILIGFSVADIPYFNYFFKHMDISISTWLQHDKEGINMLYTESSYYKYYFLFFILCLIFSACVIHFSKKWKNYFENKKNGSYIKLLVIAISLAVVCYMGIFRKHHLMEPILLWTAYLSPHSFINELTVSPTYNFMVSVTIPKYKNKEIIRIPEEDAFKIIKRDFINQNFIDSISPICRKVVSGEKEIKANVVIVLMESMSSDYLNKMPHLTPYLNVLKDKSYYFKNIYSTATHTNQGIFSTLYGIPSFFDKVIMDDRAVNGAGLLPHCEGLPVNLNKKGYTSSFFVSHEKTYNNMDMFLYKNGYQLKNIYSKENYPESEYVNYWGVDDNYLLQFAAKKISEKNEYPFFATIMTITNHPEYIVPKEFTTISTDPTEQTTYYADYSIKRFMENAEKQDWFKNTIFVFVGDHGKNIGKQDFEMSLSLNQVPLIIYSPMLLDAPKSFDCFGSQIDVFPTVMGLINMEYENNSMGMDLLKEKRPYTVFSSDDKLGCIDEKYLYCYNTVSKQEILYDYKNNNVQNIIALHKNIADSMRNYASASVQVADYMLTYNK